ncbi:MAG TPA: tripartite tricarboxylate transporter substrate binding protein [Burkholderiales bacterium]|nr:tripartite tricarboxylate transporter substrate binding protein [Burkholderiales bacterium]
MNKLKLAATFAAVALTSIATSAVHAQTYPTKTIRLVIPFPPGGSNDIVGRVLASTLSERLGRQVVADNRAGGNSIIGTELVANAAPDGYTLLVISTSFTTNPVIHKLPFDPLKAFDWVAMLGVGPNVLAVTQSLPAKSIKELIALAKAKPGQIIYASTGVGSNAHFGTELFKHMTGTNMIHVPYKGGGPALIDTISGQAQICLSSLIQAVGHIRSNKLRALGTSGAVRTAILPDVPTIAEAGVPGYETQNWWGIAAPRGTPPAVIQRLNQEISVVLKAPETEKRLRGEGAEPVLKSPDELGKYVAAEMDKWVKLAKIAGIKGE